VEQTVYIVDDGENGVIGFDASESNVVEDAGDFNLTLTRSDGSHGAQSVPYTLSGTAVNGTDYLAPSSGTVEFGDGELSKTIVFSILGDDLFKFPRTIEVQLGFAAGGAIVGISLHTITIVDDDTFRAKNASYLGIIDEGLGSIRFRTTRTGSITGRINWWPGVVIPFAGKLDSEGRIRVDASTIRGIKGKPDSVELTMDGNLESFVVTTTRFERVTRLGAGERLMDKTDAAYGAAAGNHTSFMDGPELNPGAGPLRGVTSFRIGANGGVRFRAWAPDTSAFSYGSGV
jgi:hypothetical protein